jgi:hypothetical protein
MKRLLACIILISACAPRFGDAQRELSTPRPAAPTPVFPPPTKLQFANSQIITPSPGLQSPGSNPPSLPPPSPTLSPDEWKTWPVIPIVDPTIRAIYEYGQTLGNDPRAFSLFGDCQARPDEFFGVFETNADFLKSLSPDLKETVANFEGSFNRESPTAQDGTTPGALLWTQWHQGQFTCTFAETPVECELRIHHPSFVIIQIGTHFESRNTEYLRKIIVQLIDQGIVPILATKADNREKDERVNRDMARLASEYDLPLWNFWAAVSDLPNHGLYTREDRPLQGDIYLTEEAARIHRMTGLEALNVVWRAVTGE